MKKFPLLATLALAVGLALAAGCAGSQQFHQAQAQAIQAGEQTQQAVATGLAGCAKSEDPATRAQCTLGLVVLGLQHKTAQVQQARPHPAWGILGNAVNLVGKVGTIWAAGEAARGLADTVGKSAGHNTTITGTASGTQSGVVVTPGAGSKSTSQPADSHQSTTTNSTP